MTRDPLVEEIHRVRREMWKECGGDLDKYFDRIQADEARDRNRLVSKVPRPRKPTSAKPS